MPSVKQANLSAKPKYADDEYVHVENEFEQVQKFLSMYISYRDKLAAMHLYKEMYNNALDECVNVHSPGNKIEVFFDEDTGMITVSDNGRGIPHDLLLTVCTKKHTTTKEGRKFNVESAGENGVGLKVTCALSDICRVTSYRGMESKTIVVTDGHDINEGPIVKLKKPRTGLTVEFKPSEKYLGKFVLSIDDLCEWLRCMSYICPSGIQTVFMGKKRKSNTIIKRVYEAQGLAADVKYLSPNMEFQPIQVGFDQSDADTPEHEFMVDMAFTYDLTLDGEAIDSYCNYVHTIENGTHVNGCESAICSYFVKEGQKLDPNNKYPIAFEDCKKGLVLVVNCRAVQPHFSGQVKERVGNPNIQSDTRKQMIKAMENYFIHNPSTLKKIVDYLRKMARIRLTAHSMKGLETKKAQTWADERAIPNFIGLADRNSKGYKELFICEGLSGGKHVGAMVDHRYQAVYYMRGVLTNAFDMPTDRAMKSDVLRDLIKVLGCGIGKDFNMANLRWDRIIILTDSDVDGNNITSLICAFFAKHLPEVITEGRLFKSIPPLYLLKENQKLNAFKGKTYIFNKREYNELYAKAVSENVDVSLLENLSQKPDGKQAIKLSKKDIFNFMMDNQRYLYHLSAATKNAGAPVKIVEAVCWEWIQAKGDEKKFKKLIESDFPEMKYDMKEHSLTGAFNKQHTTIIVDGVFLHMARKFIGVLQQNDRFIVGYKNQSTGSQYLVGTIGEFLTAMSGRFTPDFKQRFKGLGEMDGELLFISTLNPAVRKLYKITMFDVEQALRQLDILHGKNNADARKAMIANDAYTIEDIDN